MIYKALIKRLIFDDSDEIEAKPPRSCGYLTQIANSWIFRAR